MSQEQGVRKETKDNGRFKTEHQGRSGSNFSHHAATRDAELPETFGGMCWQQGTPPHRHYIQEVNIVIKMPWDKDNLVINSCKKIVYFSFYFNLKIIKDFCRTLYIKYGLFISHNTTSVLLIIYSSGQHVSVYICRPPSGNNNVCLEELIQVNHKIKYAELKFNDIFI